MLCGRVSGIFLGWWLDVSSEYSMGCLYSVVGLYLVSIWCQFVCVLWWLDVSIVSSKY